jgi:hypothetical protein
VIRPPEPAPKAQTKRRVLLALTLALLLQPGGVPAARARHCAKGKPCGNTCISKDETCHLGAPGQRRTDARNVGGGSGLHPVYCTTCARDSQGRIKRSSSARRAFLKSKGLSHTPLGCQVDHTIPLGKGGKDEPSNMQLLCGDALKAKEATELR